jgi:hypothetical protein
MAWNCAKCYGTSTPKKYLIKNFNQKTLQKNDRIHPEFLDRSDRRFEAKIMKTLETHCVQDHGVRGSLPFASIIFSSQIFM